MIKSPARVRESEAEWNREVYASMEYPEALERFAAMWNQAELLNPGIGKSWEEDIKPDIEMARILNGLPQTT
ncbi:hypothetical protein ACFL3H_02065 [Gemmatimonadota bacterium]